uniref:hexokinase n=1 Tax=Amphiprion ocellaris TaxID=80972 RepID=A0A3Q1CBV6_AMPOC
MNPSIVDSSPFLYVRVVEEQQKVVKMDSKICSIPQEMMLGTGEQLFDHIAQCLGEFLESQDLKGQTLPLGFTFSFPCEQKEIDKVSHRTIIGGLLITKGNASDYVGLLVSSLGKLVASLGSLVDTLEMLLISLWMPVISLGMLVASAEMLFTRLEMLVVNVRIFEKMISGMYLGEIVRLLLVKMAEDKLLFKGETSEALLTPGQFETKYISEIEEPDSGLENAQKILTALGLNWDPVDACVVRLVCDTISSRSACLCAAALATISNRIRVNRGLDHLKTTVGVDGTVYRKHPNFSEELQAAVRLLAPECDITFLVSEDGSGKGAAMVTAVAQRIVEKYLEPFRLSLEKLKEVSVRLKKDLIRGLGKHSHHRAAVKMLPTFVRATPDGTEKGDYLALDLGGTNFRVLYVRVVEEQQKVVKMDSKICSIPQEMMLGTGEQLFDHIAQCLGEFLESQDLKGQTLPLGFTFSFPCEQKEIDKSILIRWTKGFSCSGVEGQDVVKLLKEAIHRRGDYDIGSVAMVNDTVGTMMSCGYRDQSCEIGMIIGTGTNACYMEEIKNVKRVEGEDGRMCINTEWGGFGDDGSLKDILTEFDEVVDQTSINPGVHTFEKMISGMYLGEIVRLLLVKMAEDKLLFKGETSEALLTPGQFETKYISEIEEPDSGLENAQKILTALGLNWDPVDACVVRLVCDTISSRSARLCAAALATISNRIRVNRGLDHLKTTVGVDGTVYRKHPNFSEELQAAVRLLAPKCDITFLVSEDGSGKGAAMVTAVAQRIGGLMTCLEMLVAF